MYQLNQEECNRLRSLVFILLYRTSGYEAIVTNILLPWRVYKNWKILKAIKSLAGTSSLNSTFLLMRAGEQLALEAQTRTNIEGLVENYLNRSEVFYEFELDVDEMRAFLTIIAEAHWDVVHIKAI